ncbi:hypothetical protein [Secundilactobacillus collinoides]|uniref:hypothetical protein n=1 Tax=Secundilactobacillus collinoides TaxID=33960 RepID=UPI0006D0C738|nr:hypothetical protein [Secundilactobacillus collinoides]
MNKFASSRTTRTLVIIGGLLGLVLMSNPHSTQAATRSTQFLQIISIVSHYLKILPQLRDILGLKQQYRFQTL